MRATDKLRAYYKTSDQDLHGWAPLGFGTMCDLGYLLDFLWDKEFLKELEDRGYDLNTLKFSIEPKKSNPKFSSQRGHNGTEN